MTRYVPYWETSHVVSYRHEDADIVPAGSNVSKSRMFFQTLLLEGMRYDSVVSSEESTFVVPLIHGNQRERSHDYISEYMSNKFLGKAKKIGKTIISYERALK